MRDLLNSKAKTITSFIRFVKFKNILLHKRKERAEHLMLVDLGRNDVGRAALYDSVRVEEFMVVEYYSHVMHIVSDIRGKLKKGKEQY